MPTPFRSPPNRTFTIVALAAAFVGGIAVLAAILIAPQGSAQIDTENPLQADPSPAPINLSETGRLVFPVLADAIRTDDSGRPIPGSGFAISQTCEADALAVTIDGLVTEVQARGTAASVAVGERLKGPAPHQGLMKVYRDENGDLRQGCDPDSWTIIKIE